MDEALPDVPATQIDNDIVDAVETTVNIEPSGDTIDVVIDTPATDIPETPLPSEAAPEDEGTSDVTDAEEPVAVASDVTPNSEAASEVKTEVTAPERKPDTRPKRRLGWRAYILGGSGGTK
jgi:hypothetical protein